MSPSSFCVDKFAARSRRWTTASARRRTSDPDLGPFSNIFGGVVRRPRPVRSRSGPIETLLSDGKLDAGDAPMPALRVDVNISADSTVGTLVKADKSEIYSRDGTGPTGGTAAQPVRTVLQGD